MKHTLPKSGASHTLSSLLRITSIALALGAMNCAANAQYVTIDPPKAVYGSAATGSTDSSDIVGWFTNVNYVYIGYVDVNGNFTTLVDPSAGTSSGEGTVAMSMSNGTVAGYYVNGNPASLSSLNGFTYNGTSYTTINDPAGYSTIVSGISGANIVGEYRPFGESSPSNGFIYDGNHYITLDDPLGVNGTYLTGISGQIIVGSYLDSGFVYHGFMFNMATDHWTTLDDPAAPDPTPYRGTNTGGIDGNLIDGAYSNASTAGAFVYNIKTNSWISFRDPSDGDAPGYSTDATGFAGGMAVGEYIDKYGVSHGFAVSTPEPSTLATAIGFGITAIFALRKRRSTTPR